MHQKTVLSPYGVYVPVHEVIHDGITYWFTEKAMRDAAKCARTHDEGAEPEPLGDWVFKEGDGA